MMEHLMNLEIHYVRSDGIDHNTENIQYSGIVYLIKGYVEPVKREQICD